MTTDSTTLGFIGLGRMGSPMAGRLAAVDGYEVLGFDAAGTDERLPPGVTAASSTADIASRSDTIFLSVPAGVDSEQVCREVIAAPDRRAKTIVDLSTIGIAAARRCANLLDAHGVAYIDAPVSGGVAGAVAGTLTMMVGASQVRYEQVEPALQIIASKCFRVGDRAGQGQAMKLVNNYASAAALAATCEAAVLGERLGLNLETIVDVVSVSSGRSAAIDDKFPKSILPQTYDFGFAGELMAKDVSLYLESAEEVGVPHELASATAAIWRRFLKAHPDADFTYIHQYFKNGGQ